MLNSFFISTLLGTLLGFLSGLGVGGGSLLILWLTLVLNTPQETARMINLLFFLPAALIASLFHRKQGRLSFVKILPVAAAGCIGAYLFSEIGPSLDKNLIKKLFGALLFVTGIRELRWKEKKPQ